MAEPRSAEYERARAALADAYRQHELYGHDAAVQCIIAAEADAYRRGQVAMRERAAEVAAGWGVNGFSDAPVIARAIRALEVESHGRTPT
jgi:hypothetical protein